MSTLSDALQTFFAESRGLLQDMEEALLRLEDSPDDAEAINAVFRAAHTIKGSAGLFGLDDMVAFTHNAESVLDRVRDGKLALTEGMIGLFLACRDHIERLLDLVASDSAMDADTRRHGEALVEQLVACLGEPAAGSMPAESAAPVERETGDTREGDTWHISVRFGRDVLKMGMDPLSFIRYLATLGEISHIETLPDAMPTADRMDPEECYLGFEIRFRSEADKARIEGVFEFVRDDCELRILPPGSKVPDYIRLIQELPEEDGRLGDLLVHAGVITQRELEEGLAVQECEGAREDAVQPLGEILVEHHAVQAEVVDAALAKQKDVRQKQSQEAKFIRVHADKLDELINLVGELVIAGAGVGLLAGRNRDAAMIEAVSGMARLVEDIRDGAMRLRMVEIGETFNRFRRVVRDVSKEIGKDIELVINGADTELDKSVVERIGDPLTHLVRNAMDHGIEPADLRAARGKPARGTLKLNAYHESGSIVIEVGDDGGGLNRDKILAKARQKGLVQDGDNLADGEVWNLIFEPGFSTADQVSNLSGRGVGMDVVKRNIEALRGTVEIESHAGQGSTFRIRLPLTLAIIDGFLMGVGEGHYVVPLDMVLECVEMNRACSQDSDCDYLNLRGEVLPLLRVREHFDLERAAVRRQNVVVVNAAGRKAGLVVDELKGEFQAVIKPLGRLFEKLRGISGSTILGSGEVALVLDVPSLLDEAAKVGSRA
jgi:two-component system chemotaxis sensor kinase CheA